MEYLLMYELLILWSLQRRSENGRKKLSVAPSWRKWLPNNARLRLQLKRGRSVREKRPCDQGLMINLESSSPHHFERSWRVVRT
jgi:hypothetical protein